ncbi:hypothetical protein C8F01DRAFT_1179464 [Mycena amicta]|nr:hypothetical protein C8F01DRAFT_1179464 [Mycena amicta]
MHPALEIPEILRLIVAQVYASNRDNSLNSIALTCQDFLEPALDALWKTQFSFLDFLRTFPADAISVRLHTHTTGGPTVRVLRPLLPVDWRRPLFYSHRIRHFRAYEDPNNVSRFSEVLGVLTMSLPEGGLLFPALDTLVWAHSDISTCFFIQLFLASSLRTLHIMFSPHLLSILPRLPNRLQHLETVQILLHSVNDTSDGPPISLFVRSLTSLVVLKVPVARWSDLAHLAGLRRLETLEIGRLAAHLPLPAAGSFPPDSFAALRTLKFSSASTADVSRFFHAVSSLDLQSLKLGAHDLASTSVITSLYKLIADRCSPLTLTTFEYKTALPEEQTANNSDFALSRVTSTVLRQLASFRNLRWLSLDTPAGFELDDTGLIDLARAHPELQTLLLTDPIPDPENTDAGEPLITRVTLAGLRTLAEHCPHLYRLGLSFDAMVIPPPPVPVLGKPRAMHSHLRELYVRNSVLDYSIGVASFLSDVFPNAVISVDEEGDAQLSDLWESVVDLVDSFVAARQEERAWALHGIMEVQAAEPS